jgi:hypothetical protein
VRVDAIQTRLEQGWTVDQITHDTGSDVEEVEAARRLKLAA